MVQQITNINKLEKRQKLELIDNFKRGRMSLKKNIITIKYIISNLIYFKNVKRDKYTNLKIKLTNTKDIE